MDGELFHAGVLPILSSWDLSLNTGVLQPDIRKQSCEFMLVNFRLHYVN